MRAAFLGILGITICYLACSMFAWNLNPGEWGGFLRVWFVGWAIIWGGGGAMFGRDLDFEAYGRRQYQARVKMAREATSQETMNNKMAREAASREAMNKVRVIDQ